MTERPYELVHSPAGTVARVRIRGSPILLSPLLKSGNGVHRWERQALDLTGLLPHTGYQRWSISCGAPTRNSVGR
jgi:hypothetical protein